jgi:HSP20 family protein
MSNLSRYNPYYNEGMSLRNAIDQLFSQSFVNPFYGTGTQTMMAPMDVTETSNGYEVDVALPGVNPNDIDMTVHQNTLDIKGHFSHKEQQGQPQSQQEQTQTQGQQQTQTQGQQQTQQGQSQQGQRRNYLMREISTGSFERTITFPQPIDADKITTHFNNGILTIQIPLSEASKPKKISVQSGQSSSQSQPKTVEAGSSSSSERSEQR